MADGVGGRSEATSEGGARVITITSGKGGVGKTTTTANLAAAFTTLEKNVVCIDADIGLRNLDLILGLENRIVHDLVDVVEGRVTVKQAMIRHKLMPRLSLIPAAQNRDKTAVSPAQMTNIVRQLRPDFDYVLIDCPAGIERGFRNAIEPADEILVVTNPEVSAVRDADRVIGMLEELKRNTPVHLVINRAKPEMVRRGEMLSADDVVDILSIDLIGIVPEDESVLIAGNQGVPNPNSLAGKAFRNIARRLMGQDVPFVNMDGNKNVFQRIARLFGGS
jgi:septum site-determining protein MinD